METAIEMPDEIIDEYRYCNVEFEWWDWIEDSWKTEKMPEMGYSFSKIYFDTYRMEHEFADISVDNISKIIERCKVKCIQIVFPDMKLITEPYFYMGSYKDICIDGYDDFTEEEQKKLDKLTEFLSNFIEDDIKELSRECLKELIEEEEYLTSDEAVIETILANDWYTPEEEAEE